MVALLIGGKLLGFVGAHPRGADGGDRAGPHRRNTSNHGTTTEPRLQPDRLHLQPGRTEPCIHFPISTPSSTPCARRDCTDRLRILDDRRKPRRTFDGKSVVNLSSNNYLGLTTHPQLVERGDRRRSRNSASGSGSVRTIAGTMAIHMELERRLAAFKNTEAVVVFQSGFAANAGTVSAILTKEDAIISDELNHASIIDGAG